MATQKITSFVAKTEILAATLSVVGTANAFLFSNEIRRGPT
jgi:hypothetical protein